MMRYVGLSLLTMISVADAAEVVPIFRRNTTSDLLSVLNGSGSYVSIGSISSNTYTLGGVGYAWVDTTSVAGDPNKYYTDLLGVPTGASPVAKFNRIQCGSTTATSGGYPSVPTLWTSDLWSNWDLGGQISCISALGNGAINAASRTSDHRTASGQASPGSTGVNAMAYNDDTVVGVPIANAGLFLGVRGNGVLGTTLGMQVDTTNWGSVVDVTPYADAGATGRTVGILMSPGAVEKAPNVRANPSAGLSFNPHNGIEFRKGMVVNSLALDTTLGTAGNGIFIEMAPEQEFAWRNNAGALVAELWGHATNGVQVYPGLTVSGNASASGHVKANRVELSSAAPSLSSCGTSPSIVANSNSGSGNFTTGTGSPTGCTLTFATAYTNDAHCTVTAANLAGVGVSTYVSSSTAASFSITMTVGTDSASYNYTCIGDS